MQYALPESITIFHIAELHKTLAALKVENEITFDLSATTEIDGSGMQLLIAFENSCKHTGKTMSLSHVSDELAGIFSLFNAQFDMSSNDSEAPHDRAD